MGMEMQAVAPCGLCGGAGKEVSPSGKIVVICPVCEGGHVPVPEPKVRCTPCGGSGWIPESDQIRSSVPAVTLPQRARRACPFCDGAGWLVAAVSR